jgi:hypothetical protein
MVRESLRQRFVSALESLGGSAGNARLQAEPGWRDDTYWDVHAALVEDNTIAKGRGRGGSVSLAASSGNAAQPTAAASSPVQTPQQQKAPPAPLPARNSGRNGGSSLFNNIDGDFLITRSNTPELVGHVAIADGIARPTIYPDLIMRMIPAPDCMLTRFL